MLPGVSSMAVARMLCLSIMFAIGQLGNRTTGQLINHVIGKIGIWANLNTPMSFVICDISTSPSGDNVQAPPKQRRRGKAAFILKLIYKEQKYRVASQERYLSET